MFFKALGRFVSRFWIGLLVGWAVLLAALIWACPSGKIISTERTKFLPADADSMLAKRLLDRHFPKDSFSSRCVMLIERDAGITEQDLQWMDTTAQQALAARSPIIRKAVTPVSEPMLRQKLLSRDGKAALAVLSFSTNFVSKETLRAVKGMIADWPKAPAGLRIGWTGDAVVGFDYHQALGNSVHQTTWATLLMLSAILLFVFRSLVAPLLSLISIGVSLMIANRVMALIAAAGASVASMTALFLVVMVFGAGTDYCVFLIFRYVEELRGGKEPHQAMAAAIRGVGGAISSSALTVIIGLGCMIFAQFGPFSHTGPYVALGIFIALAAGLTLMPALVLALNKILFWPARRFHQDLHPYAWKRVVDFVTRRPLSVIVAMSLLLAPLLLQGVKAGRSFDLFSELPEDAISRQGIDMLRAHFDQGEMSPLVLVLKTKQKLTTPDGLDGLYRLTRALSQRQEIRQVLSATQPTGDAQLLRQAVLGNQMVELNEGVRRLASGMQQLKNGVAEKSKDMPFFMGEEKANLQRLSEGLQKIDGGIASVADATGAWAQSVPQSPAVWQHLWLPPDALQKHPELKKSFDYFLSADGHAARILIVLRAMPFSHEEMTDIEALQAFLRSQVPVLFPGNARFHMAGAGPTILDERNVTDSDFYRILFYVLGGIFLILVVLLREFLAPLYLVLSMVFSYFVSLGITSFVFEHGMGHIGLDWKVPFFMFVLLVALGEDYNIFLMARIKEEKKKLGLLNGVRFATVRTGPLITYCGLIMAGTFLSFMLSPLQALLQLGFAVTVGVLIDTFVIRPLLVPAMVVLADRLQRRK